MDEHGDRHSFDHLVVATGATPRRLNLPFGTLTLRTVSDANELKARLTPGAQLVVVGGGFLGFESPRQLVSWVSR